MKKIISFGILALIGCSSKKSLNPNDMDKGIGDTRTNPIEYIDDNTYLLTETTNDKTYGYSQSNPIKVGGVHDKNGPKNERRFLNALLGPNGKKMTYSRAGSCCPFKTPNGFINNSGMLDLYKVTEIDSKDTLSIYLNMYDTGDLKIPFDLKAKAKP